MNKDKIELIKTAIDNKDMVFVKPREQEFLSPLKFGSIKYEKGKPIKDQRTEVGKYFGAYFDLLLNNDEYVRKNFIQQNGETSNYLLREGYLDINEYKNNYSFASLFGITREEDWDKLFSNKANFINEKNFPLLVFEPTINYNKEIASGKDEKLISTMKNTLGIINQGDQFTIVELRANQTNTDKGKLPRYVITGVVDTFKKPNMFLNENNGVVYTKTNKKKILQQISTIGPNGSRIYENADMYEIMKNFLLGAFATVNEDYNEKAQKIDHIRRIVSSNQEIIDSVSSVSFLTSQVTMSTLGMSTDAYYNTHSNYLTFSDSNFSNFISGINLKTKNEKELQNKLYKFFNVKKDSVQAKIFSEMLSEGNQYINYVQSEYNPDVMLPEINIHNFITGYRDKVSKLTNENTFYYFANTKSNDISMNFINRDYNLSFNVNSFFETNKIGEKRIVEKYQLTNNTINALLSPFNIDAKEFALNLDGYKSEFISGLRPIFKEKTNVSFIELFNNVSNSSVATSQDKLFLANMFKKRLELEYAKVFGFGSYDGLTNYDGYDIPKFNFDIDHIYGLMNNKVNLNNFVSTVKQSANIKGKELNVTQSFLDILGHLNVMGQRASQGGDKFSGAKVKLDNGITLDFANVISSWQNYDEAYNTKLINNNYEGIKETIDGFYKTATGIEDFESNLYSKLSTILYTNTDYSFQDSNIHSSLLSMKNISMYDNKNIFIPYDSINIDTIDEISEKFNLNSASEFYNRLSNFDHSAVTDNESFEHYFLKRLFGEENFSKYIDARYDADGNLKNIASEFDSIGEDISKIRSIQTIDDKKKLIEAIDDSVGKYNEFLKRYMIESNETVKSTKIIGDNFLYNGFNTGISGSNFAFIEGVNFEGGGIRINTKGLVLNSQGTKSMFDNIKATNQINTSLLTLVSDGYTYVIDSILNEKMTKGKRGFNGTFYGRSIMTMALHGITQNFDDNSGLSREEKFNRFLNIMRENSAIDINGNKTNVIDLLGMDFSYNDGKLIIGEIDKTSSSFISRLNNINELESAQNYLITNSEKRFSELLGRVTTNNDAEYLGSLIYNKLYDAYDVYLSQLNVESQKKAKIFFESEGSYLEKSYVDVVDGAKKYGINKIHDIDKSGAYKFFSFSHMMKESKAMEVDEALKFTRLTNIVFSENGLNWLNDEIGEAVVNSRSSKLISDIALLPQEIATQLFGESEYGDLMESLFKNQVDMNDVDNVTNTKNGYKFLSKNVIGKNLKYSQEENALTEHFYGTLSGFNPQLKEEISHLYNTLSNKDTAFDLSLDYLARSIYKDKIKSIMNDSSSYDAKIKKINELVDVAKGQLRNNFKYAENGNYSKINIKDVGVEKAIYQIFRKTSNDFVNENNKKAIENFIGFYNQFVISNEDLVSNDFSGNVFKFERADVDMINLYFKNKFENDRINFGKLINEYSGEKLINFRSLSNIVDKGFMPFKITNFSIDGSGDIVFNGELNTINNIISNNTKLTKLQNIYNKFDESSFVNLDKTGEAWKNLYNSIDYYNQKFKDSKDRLDLDYLLNFSDYVVNLDNDKEKKYYNNFLDTVERLTYGINKNGYKIEDKRKDLMNVSKYIVYTQEKMKKYSEELDNEIAKRNSFIKNRETIDEFMDNVDFRLFNKIMLSNNEFKTSSDVNTSKIDKIKNTVSVNVKDFLENMQINVKENKFLFTSPEVSNSILSKDNIITFTTDNMFSSIINKLTDKNGNIVENVSYKDIADTIDNLINYSEISNNENNINLANEYIERGKEYIKKLFIENYLYNDQRDFIERANSIKIYNRMRDVMSKTYEYNIGRILTNTVNNITKYSPELQLLDDTTFYKPQASATIQGSEGSSIMYHIKNSFNELINLDPNEDMYAKKKEEFLNAMSLVFGDFRRKRVESYIEDKNYNGLNNFLNSMSGVIIGTDEQFRKMKEIYDEFGDSKFIYGFGSRNPHQYIGSIRASRFVKLDENDRNLSFLRDFIGSENRIDTKAPYFNFIGKRTALGMNGDFDGDRYQLLKFTLNDFRFSKKNRRKLLNKINLDSEINYILNDMSSEDLRNIFKNHIKLNKEKEYLATLIKHRAKHDGIKIKNNSEAFDYIEERYYALRFEYFRAQDALLDENSQHAVLPSIKDLILNFKNGDSLNVSRSDFSEFVLSLNDEMKKELLFKIINKEDMSDLEKIFEFNDSHSGLIKKINEFRKLTGTEQEDNMYMLLRDLTKQVTKGNLKINNKWLADTGYEAYTGIHRTGPVHSALTSFREFTTIASQKTLFNSVISNYLKNNETILGEKEILNKINKITSVSDSIKSFNTYGTMIEKLSISSKLGGGADPYLNMEQLNKTDRLISNYLDNDTLISMFDFGKIYNVTNDLKTKMDKEIFSYNGKTISSINDIAELFFSNNKDDEIFNSIKQSIAVILNKDFSKNGFDTDALNISASNLLATISNIGLLITKGTITNTLAVKDIKVGSDGREIVNKKIVDVYGGLRSQIDEKGLLYNIIKYFDPKNPNVGIRYETALKEKFINAIKTRIGIIKNKAIEDTSIETTSILQSTEKIIEQLAENNQILKGELESLKRSDEINEIISETNNIEKSVVVDSVKTQMPIIESSNINTAYVESSIVEEIPKNNYIDKDVQNINPFEEKYNLSQMEVNNLKSELRQARETINKLNDDISNLNVEYNGHSELKTNNQELVNRIESIQANIEETEAKARIELEKANQNIEKLTKDLSSERKKVEDVTEQLSDIISKKNESEKANAELIIKLKEQIKNLTEQNENIKKTTQNAKKVAEETSKLNDKTNMSDILKRNKKMLTIGGAVATLGLFFRIFQSNRSVVELDINDKQYEETKGSLYRSLGNYNINTNIREFY